MTVLRPRTSEVAAALALVLAAVGISTPALAAIAFDPIATASTAPAWTVGNALGRSASWLHLAWASDCPPPSGTCATERGPYEGVFWQRASIGPSPPWSAPVRVSQHRKHASRPALAASGTDLYVAWVTRRSYLHPRPSAPQVLWVRSSADEGDDWGSPVRLSARGGRVDFPVVAASGSNAWVVWTNADGGAIRLAVSTDDGGTWTVRTVGATTAGASSSAGYRGFPAVGASGGNVVAAWVADGSGRLVALTSSAGASDWTSTSTPTQLLASGPHGPNDYPSVRGADDGATNDVSIAYATADGIEARRFDGSSIGPGLTVVGPWPQTVAGRRYDDGYGPAVTPFGPTGLAVAWAGCRHRKALTNPCAPNDPVARIDVLERETPDDGSTWSAIARVALARKGTGIEEAPSLEVGAAGARWFSWLHRAAGWSIYEVRTRSATSS